MGTPTQLFACGVSGHINTQTNLLHAGPTTMPPDPDLVQRVNTTILFDEGKRELFRGSQNYKKLVRRLKANYNVETCVLPTLSLSLFVPFVVPSVPRHPATHASSS